MLECYGKKKLGVKMKKIESLFFVGCAYAVAIVALFFGFAAISSFAEVKIGVGQFFLILLFGQIIAVAGYILKNAAWHALIRYPLHYLTLFCAFCLIFIVSGNISNEGGSAIFSAVIIFTFFYALAFLIIFAVKKAISSIEKKSNTKTAEKNTVNTQTRNQKNKNYTPRFK